MHSLFITTMKEEKETYKYIEQEAVFSEDELRDNLSESELNNKGSKISESWIYKLFVKSAYKLLHKPLTVFRILKKAVARLQKYGSVSAFAKDAVERIQTIIRLIQAYVKGEYKHVSLLNIALSLAGILYFLSPLDLIPDFLAFGFLDDLALLTWIYNNLQGEIERFLQWEDDQLVRVNINQIES